MGSLSRSLCRRCHPPGTHTAPRNRMRYATLVISSANGKDGAQLVAGDALARAPRKTS